MIFCSPSLKAVPMPESNPTEPAPDSSTEAAAVSYEVALEVVGRVVAWYAQQIHAERRAPDPDLERLTALATAKQDAQEDVEALEEADEAETARLAALYEARFRELTEQ
jgi:hypothetical protein